jgi:hypothetical protein
MVPSTAQLRRRPVLRYSNDNYCSRAVVLKKAPLVMGLLARPDPSVPWADPCCVNFDKDFAWTRVWPRSRFENHRFRRAELVHAPGFHRGGSRALCRVADMGTVIRVSLLPSIFRFGYSPSSSHGLHGRDGIGSGHYRASEFGSGMVSGWSSASTTKTARRLAGSVSLAFSLTR